MKHTPGDPVPAGTVVRWCPGCSGYFIARKASRGRGRTYCSKECRLAAARARHADQRAAVDQRAHELATAPLHPDAPAPQPCRWCSAPTHPGDYCSTACATLHTRMLHLAQRLRGVRRTTPVPGLVPMFDELAQLRAARRSVRTARRSALREEAQQQLDHEAQVQQRRDERERLRAAAHQRLQAEAQRKADRVARRQAKKGN